MTDETACGFQVVRPSYLRATSIMDALGLLAVVMASYIERGPIRGKRAITL